MTDHPNLTIGRAAMDAAAPGIPDLIDASLATLAPNTAQRIYEQIWGDVYQDPTLGLRDRTLISIAAATAIGGAETNLTRQTHIALNAGITPAEIVATIEHVAVVAGFPRTQTALNTVRDVFTQRNVAIRTV
jgi:4-carboxymuconolactone decarboxylase